MGEKTICIKLDWRESDWIKGYVFFSYELFHVFVDALFSLLQFYLSVEPNK